MKILKIEIQEFGKLRDRTFEFDESMTLIRGDNESGKSTLMLFIRTVLYGLPKKQRGAEVSDADRALSWERNVAAGSMTILHEGKTYRIERRITKMARTLSDNPQVIDCESGTVCTRIGSPGEFFLGIPAEVFDSSCGIAQLGTSDIKGESVASAVENLASSADETVNTEKILESLDGIRKKYLHKNKKGGSIYELESKKATLREQYARAVSDNFETERLEKINADLELRIGEVSEKKNTADELYSKVNIITAIRLFDKLHAFEASRDALTERIRVLKESNTKGDFIPDRKYLAELRGAMLEAELAVKEAEAERTRLEAKKSATDGTDSSLLSKFDTVTALGGADAVRRELKKQRSRTKLFLALAVITAQLSAVAAVFFLPAASALILALVLGGLAISSNATLGHYCKGLGVKPKDAEELLEAYENHLAAIAARKAELDAAAANVAIKEKIAAAALEKLGTVLISYSEPSEDARAAARSAEETISAFLDELERSESALVTEKEKIASLSAELEEYNEHKTRAKISPELLAMSDEEMQRIKRDKKAYEVQLKTLEDKKHTIERTLLERKYSTKNPFELAEELGRVSDELEREEEEYAVIMLTIESISTAAANMRGTLTPRLRALTGDYLTRLTHDKYTSLSISDGLDVSISADGFSRPLDAFSTGTRDLTYLALRLSLLKVLSRDDPMPVFMDETLAMIDDKRASSVLSLLREYCTEGGQAILFSCHKREEELCRAANIPHSSIEI